MSAVLALSKQQLFNQAVIQHANIVRPIVPLDLTLFTYELIDSVLLKQADEYLAIRPYVTLRDMTTNKIFSYRQSIDPSDPYAIGVGRFIEVLPQEGQSIVAILIESILSQLESMVQLVRTGRLRSYLQSIFQRDEYKLIYTEGGELGIWFPITVDFKTIKSDFADTDWMYKSELHLLTRSGIQQLEPWSASVLSYL